MDTGVAIGTIVGLIGVGYIILKVIQAIAAAVSAAEGSDESNKDGDVDAQA